MLYTKSSGFEHPIVKPTEEGGPSFIERRMQELAQQHGWEVVHSKNGGLFTKESLARFDTIVFYANGDLTQPGTDQAPPWPENGKAALLSWVASGKGLVGVHAAADAFQGTSDRFEHDAADAIDPFLRMLGGQFIHHGPEQTARVLVTDPSFPGLEDAGTATMDFPFFELNEEWYTFKNFAPDLHVVLALDTDGMEGDDYARPRFPVAWARTHGKGRVFYTALGHREDVWENPIFEKHLVGAINWSLGHGQAEWPANIDEVTPEARVLQPNPARMKK